MLSSATYSVKQLSISLIKALVIWQSRLRHNKERFVNTAISAKQPEARTSHDTRDKAACCSCSVQTQPLTACICSSSVNRACLPTFFLDSRCPFKSTSLRERVCLELPKMLPKMHSSRIFESHADNTRVRSKRLALQTSLVATRPVASETAVRMHTPYFVHAPRKKCGGGFNNTNES